MAIGERDWETESFIGSVPTLGSLRKGIELINENQSLTVEQKEAMLKHQREIEQYVIDRDQYSGVVEILTSLNI